MVATIVERTSMSNLIAHSTKMQDRLVLYSFNIGDGSTAAVSVSTPKTGKVLLLQLQADYDDGSTTTPGICSAPNSWFGTSIFGPSASGANSASDDAIQLFSGGELMASGATFIPSYDSTTGGDPGERTDIAFLLAGREFRDVSLVSYSADNGSDWSGVTAPKITYSNWNPTSEYYIVMFLYCSYAGTGNTGTPVNCLPTNTTRVLISTRAGNSNNANATVLIGKVSIPQDGTSSMAFYGSNPALGSERNALNVMMLVEVK
jgi:hypothetical protein